MLVLLIYCIVTYLFMCGMIMAEYPKKKSVPSLIWTVLFFSPITVPCILGYIASTSLSNKQ